MCSVKAAQSSSEYENDEKSTNTIWMLPKWQKMFKNHLVLNRYSKSKCRSSVKQLSKALFRQINGKWTGSYISLFYSTFLHIPMIREQLWVSVSFPQMLGHC